VTLLVVLFDAAFPRDLAAGRYPAPAWVILSLAGVIVVGVTVFLVVRHRRAEKT
jgi:hypothetical protein